MRRSQLLVAVGLSVGLHALGVIMAVQYVLDRKPKALPPVEQVIRLEMVQIQPPRPPAVEPPERPDQTPSQATAATPVPESTAARQAPPQTVAQAPATDRPVAYMDAPPAPSAQEWALAASYTLKNSKRYRHNWGQQVRSMMGTAVEGPDQGAVRFRIEMAPDGRLARLDTLWTTSESVEQRARKAVEQMLPLPPTPNGKPLIFEKTIVFDAFTADAPPLYKNDCEPDPVQHGNRFVWDGRSPQVVAEQAVAEKLDPVAYADCLKQLPQDSIEAEAASDERQLKQWASPTLGR
ncbi:MAG: hypothetical protein C0443_06850 [Comamonadaceae bacterium]|nr:hypothetical protein [Comamonadaceae bacterium]